jgi:HSP20 family molecular chaperone IbpA
VPKSVNLDRIEASFEEGVLTVTRPKKPEVADGRSSS